MPAVTGIIPAASGLVPLDDHLELVAGDDRKAADGRALTWSSGVWPDLAGAALSMAVGYDNGLPAGPVLTWTGVVPASPSQPTTVTLDVSSSDTAALQADLYDYTLTATLADGDKVTLAVGKLTVEAAPAS